jgi:hypothetical protein
VCCLLAKYKTHKAALHMIKAVAEALHDIGDHMNDIHPTSDPQASILGHKAWYEAQAQAQGR